MALSRRRLTCLSWLALSVAIVLAACGDEDDALGDLPTPTGTASIASATAGRAASPANTVAAATPSATPAIPATATEQPVTPMATAASEVEPSPSVPWVDTAQLDNPALGVSVYWLGEQFDADGEFPPLALLSVFGPAPPGGGPVDSRAELQYASDSAGTSVVLRLMRRPDWDALVARNPATDDRARIARMFWDSPCAQQENVELEGGQAVIYSSYQALAASSVSECPAGPFDRYLAHVVFGETVVLVNAPHYLEDPAMPGFEGAYNSLEGLRLVVESLRLREPVVDPTPPPTPVARLDNPGSLVLQPVDLPGRYGYGDDGCSPRSECFVGPTRFSSEGGHGELSAVAGEFVALNYQYEHVGFSGAGAPDPNIEPPRIDSLALVCLSACDPAAILDASSGLLRYYGHDGAHEGAAELEGGPALGDEARLFAVDTLVFGVDATGFAVIWRHEAVVAMVVVGGAEGDRGRELAIELATKQEERIARSLEQ